MRVLSLFDGISCGRVALDRAGIDVTKYDAYEIDTDAILVSKDNWNDIEHKGDVFSAEYTEGQYDMVIGGSPCTHWSIARGGIDRETTSEGVGFELFMQFVRAIEEVKPKWFIYENNNSISTDIKNEISQRLGVEPVMIDSKDFSAQNRERCYWTNIPVLEYGTCDSVISDILYEHEYHTYSFEQYTHTVRWSKDGSTISWDSSGKGYYSQQNRAKVISVKSPTLPCSTDKTKIYLGGTAARGMHPVECERLQTLPDNYTKILKSKGKRIKGIGNGWTVDVIVHILKGINN